MMRACYLVSNFGTPPRRGQSHRAVAKPSSTQHWQMRWHGGDAQYRRETWNATVTTSSPRPSVTFNRTRAYVRATSTDPHYLQQSRALTCAQGDGVLGWRHGILTLCTRRQRPPTCGTPLHITFAMTEFSTAISITVQLTPMQQRWQLST